MRPWWTSPPPHPPRELPPNWRVVDALEPRARRLVEQAIEARALREQTADVWDYLGAKLNRR